MALAPDSSRTLLSADPSPDTPWVITQDGDGDVARSP